MSQLTAERNRLGFGSTMGPGTERFAWYFLRVSGVLLVFFALGHLFITHYINVPSDTTFDFVAERWANPLWRSFDTVLLFAALWHGLVGLRMSINDFLRNPMHRQISYGLVWIVGLIITVIGTITIVSFDKEMSSTNSGPLSGEMWIAEALGASLFVFAIITYVSIVVLGVWVVRNLREGRSPIYTGDAGQYAWVLHRSTGIGILFFLLVHVIDIMLIGLGRDVYDHSVEFYANPWIIPMEIILVGAVIYHTLNGLRIIAINFSQKGPSREKQYFWWVLGLSILLTAPSGVIIYLAEF
jgi:succinate dehydrogenase cytochrome b556 subunit